MMLSCASKKLAISAYIIMMLRPANTTPNMNVRKGFKYTYQK